MGFRIIGNEQKNVLTPHIHKNSSDWKRKTVGERNKGFLIADQAPDCKQHMDFDAEIINSKPVDASRSVLHFEFDQYKKKATFPNYPAITYRAKHTALHHSKVKLRIARGNNSPVIGFKFK